MSKSPYDLVYDDHEQYEEDKKMRNGFNFGNYLVIIFTAVYSFALGAIVVELHGSIQEIGAIFAVGYFSAILVAVVMYYVVETNRAKYHASFARRHAFNYHKAVQNADKEAELAKKA